MERDSLQRIFGALTRGEVRYLVAGGLAVLAHGVLRLTQDVDLILALSAANLRRAVDVLTGLGFRPVAPVAFEDFLRPELRQAW